jgi:hypothetical protein
MLVKESVPQFESRFVAVRRKLAPSLDVIFPSLRIRVDNERAVRALFSEPTKPSTSLKARQQCLHLDSRPVSSKLVSHKEREAIGWKTRDSVDTSTSSVATQFPGRSSKHQTASNRPSTELQTPAHERHSARAASRPKGVSRTTKDVPGPPRVLGTKSTWTSTL